MYVGMATLSHVQNSPTIVQYENFMFIERPVISGQPGDLTRIVGQSATFSVVATGPAEGGDLRYQWLHNGLPKSGANQASYTIDYVAEADAGTWSVEVATPPGPC